MVHRPPLYPNVESANERFTILGGVISLSPPEGVTMVAHPVNRKNKAPNNDV